MKKFKKILSLTLALVLCLSVAVPAFAVDTSTEYLIDANGNRTNITMDEIDQLIQEKNLALFNEDYETAEAIQNQLYELGGHPSTVEELASLSEDGLMTLATVDATFSTYYSTSYVNGVAYEIRRIYCSPGDNCNLHHTGVVTTNNNLSVKANACTIAEILGKAFVGASHPAAGAALTVLDCFSTLSPTTVIQNISASYTYNAFEYPIFFAYKSNNSWDNFATSSYANVALMTGILGVKWNNTVNVPTIESYNNNFSIYPTDYNNAVTLLSYYFNNSYLFTRVAELQYFSIINGNGNVVKNIFFTAPGNTSDIF